jgi:NIMA (never in mitosis gene a)-related kinase
VQDRDGKQLVMKIIDMSRMDSKHRKEAANEVKVLSSLKHPYIINYRESFTENHKLAIVMDYADGGDLHDRIHRARKAGKTFEQEKIVRWFTEATLALKYMHDKHVLHRDLKSQNLFLTSQDRLRIGDFGISKVLESTLAFARTTIGTPYYLSPEICMEKPYSFASDIWALGCILYELAALRVPFDAGSLQSLIQKITRGPTPVIPSTYHQDLRQLCCDLLHREQERRPAAAEILQKSVIQAEIRRMLHEEQKKSASKENEDNRQERELRRDHSRVSRRPSSEVLMPSKSPSIGSAEANNDLSARHRTPLKGVGGNLCENGSARTREPSESRDLRAFGKTPQLTPLHQRQRSAEPLPSCGQGRLLSAGIRRRYP